MVKSVAAELKTDVKEDMRAATITAISRPRTPAAQEQKEMRIQQQKEQNHKCGNGNQTENSTDGETQIQRSAYTIDL